MAEDDKTAEAEVFLGGGWIAAIMIPSLVQVQRKA